MTQSAHQLARRIDFVFSDEQLLQQALTHRSSGSTNNERLEFLGDAVLGQVIANALFHRFSEATEGELSRLRAALVRKETLAAVAQELSLGDALRLGPGELRSGGHTRASILADALEALLAAVYLDSGKDAAERVILSLFKTRIEELTLHSGRKDPKTRLQELLQGRGLDLPTYEVVEVSGAAHEQQFSCRCRVDDLDLETTGEGGSRRKAEQAAAGKLLRMVPDVL